MVSSSPYGLVAMALIMGFSIYLSFPIILKKNTDVRYSIILVSFAVGILVFLAGDIFSDVASQLYSSSSYVANPWLALTFVISVLTLFLVLYFVENTGKHGSSKDSFVPNKIALIVAIGMGLQNLTEGLVFGFAYAAGFTGFFLVILIGFILQNFTEGFPIASPFIGRQRPKTLYLAGLYFIGGFPTIAGSLMGYYYSDPFLNVLFDGLAIGAILYVIMPMLRNLFKQAEIAKAQGLVNMGIVIGFLVGFVVNVI